MNFSPDQSTRELEIIGERETRRITDLSRVTRWRMARAGKFPKPIKLSAGRHGWRRVEVLNWLAALQEAR